jgi:hypothetical protein
MGPGDRSHEATRRTLGRLALSESSAAAQARVDDVVFSGGRAAVVLLLNGDQEYSIYFQRDRQGWREASSSSGRVDPSTLATLDWDQP